MAHELPDLIDKEVQPKVGGLTRNIILHHLGEALDGNPVVLTDLPHQIQGFALSHTEVRGVGFGERSLPRGGDGLTVLFPGSAVQLEIGFLEGDKVTPHVQVMLELGDVSLLAVVALQLVQDFHEHFQDRSGMIPSDAIELLVDVEQDASGRDRRSFAQVRLHDLILDLGQNKVRRSQPAREGVAIEHQRKDF